MAYVCHICAYNDIYVAYTCLYWYINADIDTDIYRDSDKKYIVFLCFNVVDQIEF